MIQVSRAAIAEINRIRSQNALPTALCRLSVQPGPCADLRYEFSFDNSDNFDNASSAADCQIDCDPIQLVIDAHSLRYLEGVTIDYSEDLMGGAFRFHNPNAIKTCDCGNSFSVAPES